MENYYYFLKKSGLSANRWTTELCSSKLPTTNCVLRAKRPSAATTPPDTRARRISRPKWGEFIIASKPKSESEKTTKTFSKVLTNIMQEISSVFIILFSFLASGDADGKITIWDWRTHKIVSTWKAHDNVCISTLWRKNWWKYDKTSLVDLGRKNKTKL